MNTSTNDRSFGKFANATSPNGSAFKNVKIGALRNKTSQINSSSNLRGLKEEKVLDNYERMQGIWINQTKYLNRKLNRGTT